MPAAEPQFDLLVVGAGINGAGIARDAAGRGLKVLLVEQGDLAAATSQWSTKLIHGGLRYLERYEFRLVRESLAEREVLLRQAPHLVEPLSFVLPHEPHLRPAWMIRAGLFLYDHLGRRERLHASFGVDLRKTKWGAGLKSDFARGFVYADARVDDARLVVANVLDARARGADVRVRTRLVAAERARMSGAPDWRVMLRDEGGAQSRVRTRVLVNVAGPWVKEVRDLVNGTPSVENVRHVKGSHIVVPRVHDEDHAYLLQNVDQRVVFVIPYEDRYSLIGTTDVPVEDFARPAISDEEVDYLLALANRYLARPLTRTDIASTFSGVRPLYDDGSSDPSAITRDYVFKLDGGETSEAPALSVYGGKITTYRKLAEHALSELAPFLPAHTGPWTGPSTLPGGDLPTGGLAEWLRELAGRYPGLPPPLLRGIARRHGTRALALLGKAKVPEDLGEDFGNGLTAAEVDSLVREEWARTAEDILWRRTKCGLGLTEAASARVADRVAATLAATAPR
jgi:glycerol-3-phosphate dehydrogenase